MNNLKLIFLNINKNIKNEKELKSSFIISIIGMALNNVSFLILWYYFGKTIGEINGWEPYDIFGLYGISTISYGIVTGFFAGIFKIPDYISSGNFDKFLITPKNLLLKVSTSKIQVSAFGDLLYGIVCYIIFAILSKLTIVQYLVSIILIICSGIILYSFGLVCMSVSFYLMDGYNISHGLYNMFIGNSTYHGGAFTGVLRFVFVFIMPSLLLGAVPVEILKALSINNLCMLLCLTIFWLIISVLFFYKSLRKYESNNLFGFGG